MIPSIFVSSAIADLHHLRDAIRDAINELSYTPVMSEYGDVGYLPRATAEDSCYIMLEQCQIAVIIIGKRYGSVGRDDLSVTHNEFRIARDRGTPVIALVDHEVLAFKRVFDVSKDPASFTAPGMDAPQSTFALIDDVTTSPVNNGILAFTSVADARLHLKRQLAHMFGDLLRVRFDPVRAELKDILSELKTLRHEARPAGAIPDQQFLRAIRFMVDDSRESRAYRLVLAVMRRPVDTAVPLMLHAETFDQFIQSATGQGPREIPDSGETPSEARKQVLDVGAKRWRRFLIQPSDPNDFLRNGTVGRTSDGQIVLNKPALTFLRRAHAEFRRFADDAYLFTGSE